MEHNLFKPKNFNEGKHGVVGNCNGIPMDVRYKEETPMFAKKIVSLLDNVHTIEDAPFILDYGCGVGRIAKEILKDNLLIIVGVDASKEMRDFATKDIDNSDFTAAAPTDLNTPKMFDVAYLVYVLQHIPAIEIREALQRIYFSLKDDGFLFYCSSDYRMAIRFDNGGFADDRFLGVNLQEELSRYFDLVGPAFTDEELASNKVVRKMVTGEGGGLAHPALIYKKKKISGPLFNATPSEKGEYKDMGGSKLVASGPSNEGKTPQKLVLVQKQSPGDILLATIALRDLHQSYPGVYITDMRTPANDLFANNPYITPIKGPADEELIIARLKGDPEHPPITRDGITYCNLHYPNVHESGVSGQHFSDGETQFLHKQLGLVLKRTGLRPEVYLDFNEQNWPSPVVSKKGFEGKYWVLNAGAKQDFPLKQYPYFQEVVNLLSKEGITCAQIGQASHLHKALKGTVDMIGQTTLRELIRVIYHAEGVITCVSLPMHLAAAMGKPCVVVAGGREGTRWELYPDHRFLYVNGALPCCSYDGCWKSKLSECLNVTDNNIPLCMKMIKPQMVSDSVLMYYEGGILQRESEVAYV